MLENFMVFLKAFFALFVIMDSLGNVPIFIATFSKSKDSMTKENIRKVTLTAYGLLIVFILGGEYVLKFFGITLESFMIAGGLILMITGLQSVRGLKSNKKDAHKYSEGVVPIATPIIVGPGTLATTLLLVQNDGMLITFLAATLNILVVWFVLKKINIFHRFLGKQGSEVMSRIMGLILVALAVEFIRRGIQGYLNL